jgi:hypothetical protein
MNWRSSLSRQRDRLEGNRTGTGNIPWATQRQTVRWLTFNHPATSLTDNKSSACVDRDIGLLETCSRGCWAGRQHHFQHSSELVFMLQEVFWRLGKGIVPEGANPLPDGQGTA